MKIDEATIVAEVAKAVEMFYERVIASMDNLDIEKVMKRKNPYLYKVKGVTNVAEIVSATLSAFVSSSEETVFGDAFFEPIALAVSGGTKSMAEGIDIEIHDAENNSVTVYAVKSGPNVFNAQSRKKQVLSFMNAQVLARQAKERFLAYIGYGYGTKKGKPKTPRIYQELAGQAFWTELTGDPEFYVKLIGYIGDTPQAYIKEFQESYDKAYNRLIRDFTSLFCKEDGSIYWEKLVRFNSGSQKDKTPKTRKRKKN